MSEKIKKSFLFFLILLVSSLIFKEVSDYLDKQKLLENLKYTSNTIENFYLVSKSDYTYTLKGYKLLEKRNKFYIENPDVNYFGEKGSFNIKSKKGLYDVKEKMITFYSGVNFKSKDIWMETEYIFIDTEKKIAYNDISTTIFSENMTTKGRNLFLDIDKEILKLDKVNSQFRGKDG